MDYTQEQINEFIEQTRVWINTPEGKAEIEKAFEQADIASEELKKAFYVSPEKLKMIMNI